jgi:hypothetical protein
MIADVYNFLQYVQKVSIIEAAKALFLLYFPSKYKQSNFILLLRFILNILIVSYMFIKTKIGFSSYIDNPLKEMLCAQILRSNVDRIKNVDDMIRSLIRTRYTNLGEYKLKIIYSSNLPTYIKYILSDNGFWSPNNYGIISANSLRTHTLNTMTGVFEQTNNIQSDIIQSGGNHEKKSEKKDKNNMNISNSGNDSKQIVLASDELTDSASNPNNFDTDLERASRSSIISSSGIDLDVETDTLAIEYGLRRTHIQSKVS